MDLEPLLEAIQQHRVEAPNAAECFVSASTLNTGPSLYSNRNPRLDIDFNVQKLPFAALQVMDPRLVVIAPGACNEKHRHAHESIFIVLSGSADLQIGSQIAPLDQGDIAYVPRWVVHQSRNR